MIIRELVEEERNKVAAFFLTLNEHDRYWRFCRPMSDAAMHSYAARIDWETTVVFGAFDVSAQLIGILELYDNGAAAEIAVAVVPAHRGHGVGRALMDRALLKAKVQGKERVTLTCLVENERMRRLARKVGLDATVERGEVEGTLVLEDARPEELIEDAAQGLMSSVTYAGVLCTRSWAELFERLMAAPAHLLAPGAAVHG
jgi:RimJ/RimL family protein N-acetyltransferase